KSMRLFEFRKALDRSESNVLLSWPLVAWVVVVATLLCLPQPVFSAEPGTVLNNTSLHINTNRTDTASYQLAGAAYINVDEGVSAHWLGTVSDAPGPFSPLVKFGEGTLHLAGNNSYTVPTVLLQGGLSVNHDHALGASALNANAGTKLQFKPGVKVSNSIGLLPVNPQAYLPQGVQLPSARPSNDANAVRWVVNSGQAEHNGVL